MPNTTSASKSSTGIGIDLTGPGDVPSIADYLFADPSFTPLTIDYTGSFDAIALLPTGHAISDISGGSPAEVVGIDRGVFISSGGGPGTENTSGSFSTSNSQPGDPRLTQTAQDAFSGAGETNDASIITFTFDASDLSGNSSITFDVFFGSDEYPEYVNTSFVDIAAIYVNGVNYALFNNDVNQPLSITGPSINTPGNFFDNTGSTYNTEYDGFSVLLNVVAPIQDGVNEVVIGIADTGDFIYDSGLFVGNVQGSNFTVGGSFIQNNGTTGNDNIQANAAPELTTLGGGQDTVSGTPDQLNGDLINGFGNDDTLNFEGTSFGLQDITVTLGSAILDIDTDGDGTDDTNVVLQGNFDQATFSVSNVNGNTEVTASGVIDDTAPQTLIGDDGPNTLTGGSGDDGIFGLGGNDILSGGDGDDEMAGADGNDVVNGDGGNDNMGGGEGNDTMNGGSGNDTMGAGFGDDSMNGGDGDDGVFGGAGNDTIVGGAGDDNMAGSYGNDEVTGSTGDDNMGGGTGMDTIVGGAGNDTVGGGEGNDVINGGDGDDFLAGGGRFDVINGGAGDDEINGGADDDTMTGGTGNDTFIFTEFNAGEQDVITDWTDGEDMFRMTGVENAPGTGLQGRFDALDITTVAGGVQIEYQGHEILLQGASIGDLGVEDFIFV